MPDGIKPGTIMLIGGGAVMFIASLLDWIDLGGSRASKTDIIGIVWLFTLIIGLGIAVLVALTTFANVEIPDNILGFTRNQLYVALSFAAFLIFFGNQFGEERAIGVTLGWIAAAVAVAGGIMEMQGEGGGGSGGAPTQF